MFRNFFYFPYFLSIHLTPTKSSKIKQKTKKITIITSTIRYKGIVKLSNFWHEQIPPYQGFARPRVK